MFDTVWSIHNLHQFSDVLSSSLWSPWGSWMALFGYMGYWSISEDMVYSRVEEYE